jgi:hypothetical protein
MEEEKFCFKIKSGNKNKSINHYIKRICNAFFSDVKFIEITSNGNLFYLNKDDNINKSITIIEIIKRALPNLKIKHEIFWDMKINKNNNEDRFNINDKDTRKDNQYLENSLCKNIAKDMERSNSNKSI